MNNFFPNTIIRFSTITIEGYGIVERFIPSTNIYRVGWVVWDGQTGLYKTCSGEIMIIHVSPEDIQQYDGLTEAWMVFIDNFDKGKKKLKKAFDSIRLHISIGSERSFHEVKAGYSKLALDKYFVDFRLLFFSTLSSPRK